MWSTLKPVGILRCRWLRRSRAAEHGSAGAHGYPLRNAGLGSSQPHLALKQLLNHQEHQISPSHPWGQWVTLCPPPSHGRQGVVGKRC